MGKKNLSRRRFTAEQKAAILRRHFADKVAVSDLCDEYKLQPSVFYAWQRRWSGVTAAGGTQPRQSGRSAS